MPQLSLKISNNIDMTQLDFSQVFTQIHEALRIVPNLDITTCHSGVIQESFSYIGLGDKRLTKVYLEIYWLENKERSEMKKQLANNIMQILENTLVPEVEKQDLICTPRIRIANLGDLNQCYFIQS